MTSLFAALAPVFLVIIAGWAARASKLVPMEAWGGVNRITYMIIGPTYMFSEVVRAELSLRGLAFVGACMLAFVAMGVAGFLLLPLTRNARPSFASAHQGVVRWNAFVLLAATAALVGPEGSALVALMMGPTIPLVNIFTVTVHARWGHAQNPSLSGILRSIATNPLIIGCLLGLVVNLWGWTPQGVAGDTIGVIGRGALGLTLLCVGAGLDLTAIGAKPVLAASAVLLKLVLGPIVFAGIGMAMGLTGTPLLVLAMIGASPAPPAAYILSREMGGNPRLMAGIVTTTTLLSILSIPAALAIARLLV